MATPAKSASASSYARDRRKSASLAGWRVHGTTAGAARCGSCGVTTIKRWYRDDTDYREAVRQALDEYAATAGQETHNALLEHVRAAVRGDMVLTRRECEAAGKSTEIYERVSLNPALCRLILTRADPRFSHPKQELAHSGEIALAEFLRQEAADAGE